MEPRRASSSEFPRLDQERKTNLKKRKKKKKEKKEGGRPLEERCYGVEIDLVLIVVS